MSTRAEILAEIAAQFPDNTTGLITPAKLRQVVEDVTNSCLVSDTDAGTAGVAVLQSETAAQGRTALGIGGALTPVTPTALSGTQVVLTEASAQAQVFTLTANTTVKLPATGANTWAFAIFHGGGAFTLSINKADDTLLTALTAGDSGMFVFDGVAVGAY
jgi:hypothetical protein